MKTTQSIDFAALVRVCKQQVKLATRGLDPSGLVEAYLDEIPVKLSRRRLTWGTGRAGFYQPDDAAGAGTGRIVINVWICCTEERFTTILYHELAHAVNRWVNGREADCHGPLWKRVMVQLGQEPKRCHNYHNQEEAT